MNLRDLRYLLAVAEHGHFGRAAEACGISQPTLSVQLRRLEESLGVTLFERTSKTVVPTAACERLVGHARAAVAEADAILAVARGLRDQALAACGRSGALGGTLRAASLSTLLNMVAAGYGTTLIPGLAAGAAQDAGIALRPLAARTGRTVRIAWRTRFPRRAAVEAVGQVVAARLRGFAQGAAAGNI